MKVWPVKHSPLLRQPERFIARDELKSLIQKVTHNLVNIHDKTGEFLLRLDDGRVIDTKGWAGWEWTHGVGLYGIWQYYCQTGDDGCVTLSIAGLPTALRKARPPKTSIPCRRF
jgi:unsaturated rhamnogalacturonyl hydrolase